MKTVLIPISHPLDAKNILLTDVFRVLIKNDLRVVLIVPESKVVYYRNNFSQKNVFIESISLNKETWVIKKIRLSARMVLYSGSMYWQARIRLANKKNLPNYFNDRFLSILGYFKIIRIFFRLFFRLVSRSDFFHSIIKKYSPDLVFLPDIYATDSLYLGIEAQKNKIKTVGMVRSWDNLTSKGTCLFVPDKIIVHNKFLKEQVKSILSVKDESIIVTGLPHFDYYFNFIPTRRNEFLYRVGLPSNSKFILFTPYLGTYLQSTNEILQILDENISNGHLPNDLKVLVRMPPSYNVGYKDVWTSDRIFVDYPGNKLLDSGKSDWEFSEDDMTHFANSIVHSDVVLNFASTVTIDAAAFDKPVINIGFDGYSKKDFPESISDIYIVDHFKSIIASGGAPLVKSSLELVKVINCYLKNPNTDHFSRLKMVEEQCGILDGRAGHRLAKYLIDQIN